MKYTVDKDYVLDIMAEDGTKKSMVLVAGTVVEFADKTILSDQAFESGVTLLYDAPRDFNLFEKLLSLGWQRDHLLSMGYKEDV